MQTIFPILRYNNARQAIQWLCTAFGFRELFSVPESGEVVRHAQLVLGTNMIMLGSTRNEDGIQSPVTLGSSTQLLSVYVADVETHYVQSKSAGAQIINPLSSTDFGSQEYHVRDIEGHLWVFSDFLPNLTIDLADVEATAETSASTETVPMLSYENGPAAMDWLAQAFGFQEVTRWLDDEGRLSHGEMLTGSGRIMLATPTPAYESPKRHREHCATAQAWSQVPWVINGVLVYVDDVEAHRQRAIAAGAILLGEMEEGFPSRRYRVEDIEGQRWMFLEKT